MAFSPYPQTNYDPYTGLPRRRRPPPGGSLGTLPPGQSFGGGFGGGQIPGGGYGGAGAAGINVPGFTPDYKSLIEQALAPLNAQLGAEGSADAASRNAALIRGLGQFGEQFDPSGAQAAFGQDFYNQAGLEGLLPQANALAAENTRGGFSFSARSKRALEKAVQQIQDALASRGLLRSGATGIALQGAQKEFETGQYDARQSLTDYLSSAQQGFVAGERARQQQLIEAQRTEAERQARLNPPTGTRTVYPGDPGYPTTPAPATPTPVTPPTPDPIGPVEPPTTVTPPTLRGPGAGGVGAPFGGLPGGTVAELKAFMKTLPWLQNMLGGGSGPASQIRGFGGAQNPNEILLNFLTNR